MKYWHVYYDSSKKMYQLTQSTSSNMELYSEIMSMIAIFQTFDMAYEYVTKLNGRNQNTVYSQWTARR